MDTNGKSSPVSFDQWVAAGVHHAELATGVWVKIRFPDLATLVAAQRVPDTLRQVASETFLRQVEIETGDKSEPLNLAKLGELYDLNMWLVSQMLVEPTLTADEVKQLPAEDLDVLIELALRERDTDARGRVLGVAPVAQFQEPGGVAAGGQVGADDPVGLDVSAVDGVPV
jgi:hypothetical protein